MKYSGTTRSDLKPAAMGNLLCCVQVDQSTVAIREQFGKFDSVLEPGCHCMPWMVGKRVAGHLTLRLQQLDVRCETKTKVHPKHSVKWMPSCVLFSKENDAIISVPAKVSKHNIALNIRSLRTVNHISVSRQRCFSWYLL